jgi:hypothetical protein
MMPAPLPQVKKPLDFSSMRQNCNELLALIGRYRRACKTSLIQGFAGKDAPRDAAGRAPRRLRIGEGKNRYAADASACCDAGPEVALFFSGLSFHIFEMFERTATISSQTRRFCYTPCCPRMRGVRYSLNGSNELLTTKL